MSKLEGKELWKRINKLTGQNKASIVQPIEYIKLDNTVDYYFQDEEIIREMEKYHIKTPEVLPDAEYYKVMVAKFKAEAVTRLNINEKPLLNNEISMAEVKSTFCTSNGSPGNDGIIADIIDKADRGEMEKVLVILFNQFWREGTFARNWKKEKRIVLLKPFCTTYNKVNSYRTISITDILGKRMERITSKRLSCKLLSEGFDPNQFAYLSKRSAVQALLIMGRFTLQVNLDLF